MVAEEGYESASALPVSESRLQKEWVLGFSFHMFSHEQLFHELKKFSGGVVLLGNDEICRLKGNMIHQG